MSVHHQEPWLAPLLIDLDALPCTDDPRGEAPIPVPEPAREVKPAQRVDEWMPGQVSVRQSWREDPFVPLMAVVWALGLGILGTGVYGIFWIINAGIEFAHAYGAQTAGGLIIWALLILLGGGSAVCAGLHCAGCRR
jgi:hypothetical protein